MYVGIAVFITLATVHGYVHFVAKPAERQAWQRVLSLQPAEVKSIQITRESGNRLGIRETTERTLSRWERSEFLFHLSSAEASGPVKPLVVLKYKVRMETTRSDPDRVVEFDILDTRHSGIRLRSSTESSGGSMQNDGVKLFLGFLFSDPSV